MKRYAQIKCDYLDEETRFWAVDAWMAEDENEEGRVIAYIDDLSGRVIYTDPDARINKLAQSVISERVKDITENNKVLVHRNAIGIISLEMKTKNGLMTAEAETDEQVGTGYDAMYIGIQPSDDSDAYVYADLTAVKSKESGLEIYNWTDLNDEDWQQRFEISKDEIEDLLEVCRE